MINPILSAISKVKLPFCLFVRKFDLSYQLLLRYLERSRDHRQSHR